MVRLLDLRSGALTMTRCNSSGVAAFSPAEDQVVCDSDGHLVTVNVSDGESTVLLSGVTCSGSYPLDLRWSADGVEAASRSEVCDPATDQILAQTPRARHAWVAQAACTSDGRALLYLETKCLAGSTSGNAILNCSRTEYRARLLDLANGEATTVASSETPFHHLALSPDGGVVAYARGDGLHFRSTGW